MSKYAVARQITMGLCFLLVLLCLSLKLISQTEAKTRYASNIEPLKIGDEFLDIEFSQSINSNLRQMRISEFRGKFVLLDFWATWCLPCVTSFKKLDDLQRKFSDQLQIIAITREDAATAGALLSKVKESNNTMSIPSIVKDSVLSRLFPHKTIPHYVWIDDRGIVRAITGANEVNDQTISDFIAKKKLSLPLKKDVMTFDSKRSLITEKQVDLNTNEIVHQSTLTKYLQGYYTTSLLRKNGITCINHSILHLYMIGFGEFDLSYLSNSRVVLEGFKDVNDSLIIGYYTPATKEIWRQRMYSNFYTYELFLEDTILSKSSKCKMMQEDLNRLFSSKDISGKIEKRTRQVWALIRTSDEDKIRTKGGISGDKNTPYSLKVQNLPISRLISRLQSGLATELPIEDETNYKGNIDIVIDTDLTNIREVNKELLKYNLKLVQTKRDIEMLVLAKRDHDN